MKRYLWLALCFGLTAHGAPTQREWTVLFYSAADEIELKVVSKQAVKRIEQVKALGDGLGPLVTVVAQIDDPGEDPNYRYVIRYADKPSADSVDSPLVPEHEVAAIEPGFKYGEKDSGNPATLKSFIKWGVRAYPAKHYILILAGHSWGQQGLMQDFFVDGNELESSTLLKNYEVRRVLEETYRENATVIPHGKFEALLIDACTSGQLDVALEWEKVVDYFGASAIETPMNSMPYEKVFAPFIEAVKRRPAVAALEQGFFRPFVEQYMKAHGPGGDLAKVEGMVDPVHYNVMRTSNLAEVARTLSGLVSALPKKLGDAWRANQLPQVEAIIDGDENVDLVALSRVLGRLSSREKAPAAVAAAKALEQSLSPMPDPSMKRTHLVHAKAQGAWVHLDLESTTPSWQLAACLALKTFSQSNAYGGSDFAPTFWRNDKKTGELIEESAATLKCDEVQKEFEGKELPLKKGKPQSADELLGLKVKWPGGLPGVVTGLAGGRRELSVWIPARNGKSLSRKVFFRFAGGTGLRVEYIKSGPKGASLGGFSESFSPSVVRFPASGLYAAEGHSHGTHFKQGIGIFMGRELPEDAAYQWGKLPLELVEKTPYARTTEEYEQWFGALAEQDREPYLRKGFKFYRLHRFSALTGWADFLEGK